MYDNSVTESFDSLEEARAPRFRRDAGRPTCRACGDDLRLSTIGGRVCMCGWRVPEALKSVISG